MNDVLILQYTHTCISRAVLCFAFCLGYALPQQAGHREQVGAGQRRCAGGAQARCGGDCGEDLRLRVGFVAPSQVRRSGRALERIGELEQFGLGTRRERGQYLDRRRAIVRQAQ